MSRSRILFVYGSIVVGLVVSQLLDVVSASAASDAAGRRRRGFAAPSWGNNIHRNNHHNNYFNINIRDERVSSTLSATSLSSRQGQLRQQQRKKKNCRRQLSSTLDFLRERQSDLSLLLRGGGGDNSSTYEEDHSPLSNNDVNLNEPIPERQERSSSKVKATTATGDIRGGSTAVRQHTSPSSLSEPGNVENDGGTNIQTIGSWNDTANFQDTSITPPIKDTTATHPSKGLIASDDQGVSTVRVEITNVQDDNVNHNDVGVAVVAETASMKPSSRIHSKGIARLFQFLKSKQTSVTHLKYARKLKNRNHTNIRRKVMHGLFGLGFALLNHIVPRNIFVPGMVVLSLSTLLMELLRYQPGYQWMNDALHTCLGSSLRKHEMDGKFTGSFYFFSGVTVSSMLFSKQAATIGIIQLALADPSASYFGRATRHIYWSRIENGLGGIGRNKGILGFIGGALFCVPFNYRLLKLAKLVATSKTQSGASTILSTILPGGNTAIVIASLALGVAGAFADLCVPTPAITLPSKVWGIGPLPPFHIDDNFVVPIFSAFACTQLFQFLQWTSATSAATQTALELSKFLIL